MISVSSKSDFANLGHSGLTPDASSLSGCRRRSHSLQDVEGSNHAPEQTGSISKAARPRSRSFYSFETSEDYKEENLTIALKPRAKSLIKNDVGQKDRTGDGAMTKPPSKRPKANSNKDLSGKSFVVVVKFKQWWKQLTNGRTFIEDK